MTTVMWVVMVGVIAIIMMTGVTMTCKSPLRRSLNGSDTTQRRSFRAASSVCVRERVRECMCACGCVCALTDVAVACLFLRELSSFQLFNQFRKGTLANVRVHCARLR